MGKTVLMEVTTEPGIGILFLLRRLSSGPKAGIPLRSHTTTLDPQIILTYSHLQERSFNSCSSNRIIRANTMHLDGSI
ncbi:hypothetical protein AOLI_G00147520 [Acnodon oligacanthus]